jgi:hypothetical protein
VRSQQIVPHTTFAGKSPTTTKHTQFSHALQDITAAHNQPLQLRRSPHHAQPQRPAQRRAHKATPRSRSRRRSDLPRASSSAEARDRLSRRAASQSTRGTLPCSPRPRAPRRPAQEDDASFPAALKRCKHTLSRCSSRCGSASRVLGVWPLRFGVSSSFQARVQPGTHVNSKTAK